LGVDVLIQLYTTTSPLFPPKQPPVPSLQDMLPYPIIHAPVLVPPPGLPYVYLRPPEAPEHVDPGPPGLDGFFCSTPGCNASGKLYCAQRQCFIYPVIRGWYFAPVKITGGSLELVVPAQRQSLLPYYRLVFEKPLGERGGYGRVIPYPYNPGGGGVVPPCAFLGGGPGSLLGP
jgi:hypothetical protein